MKHHEEGAAAMRDGDTAGGTHHAPQRTERPDGTAHDRAGAPPQTRLPRQTRRGLLSSGGALAGLGAAGAVACAGPGIPGGGASAPRLAPASVSLLFPGWSPEQIEQLDLVVQRIGEANPGVTVEKIQAVGSAGDKLATMIAGGTPPEVAWHGALRPLRRLRAIALGGRLPGPRPRRAPGGLLPHGLGEHQVRGQGDGPPLHDSDLRGALQQEPLPGRRAGRPPKRTGRSTTCSPPPGA